MRLFIDDERFPPIGDDSIIVRSFLDLAVLISRAVFIEGKFLFLSFVSFDHDLGENDGTGMDCAKFLVEFDMKHPILSSDFTFYVHSQNPVGKENIEKYLNGYLDFKFREN